MRQAGVRPVFCIGICILIFFCILWKSPETGKAEKNRGAVTIEVMQTQSWKLRYTAQIKVHFSAQSLYNENIYLSYHVYDEQGHDIQFENHREPFQIDEQGTASIELDVDVSEIAKKNQQLTVQYDLVDEENLFWFSDCTQIDLRADATEVSYRPFMSACQDIILQIRQHTIIGVINFLAFSIAVAAVFYVKKNQMFV